MCILWILIILILTLPLLCILFLMIDDLVFDWLLSEHLQDRAKKWLEDKINKEEKQ